MPSLVFAVRLLWPFHQDVSVVFIALYLLLELCNEQWTRHWAWPQCPLIFWQVHCQFWPNINQEPCRKLIQKILVSLAKTSLRNCSETHLVEKLAIVTGQCTSNYAWCQFSSGMLNEGHLLLNGYLSKKVLCSSEGKELKDFLKTHNCHKLMFPPLFPHPLSDLQHCVKW